jgi:hypothetical protein
MWPAAFLFVIPGRANGANPESSNKKQRHYAYLDSGFAANAAPRNDRL